MRGKPLWYWLHGLVSLCGFAAISCLMGEGLVYGQLNREKALSVRRAGESKAKWQITQNELNTHRKRHGC
jgi:hypothetical protein